MPKTNDVKNVKVATEADTKKEVKVEEAKAPVKETEVKAEAKVAETKPAAAKATKKAPAKKATTKKTTTASKKKAKETVYVQHAGREFELSEIIEKAKAAYAGDAKAIKDITVYVKPEENMVYFVVNGDETGSVAL